MSKVWEDTNGCAKKYICVLGIYVITVLSYSYGIITDRSINAHGHINNVVYEINAMDKHYLKGGM